MNRIFWSAGAGGFFHEAVLGRLDIHDTETGEAARSPLFPLDIVEVSAERHAVLLEGVARGQTIAAGDDGAPVAAEPIADARVLVKLRRAERDRLLRASDWTQLADAPLAPDAKKAWREYRRDLRDLGDVFDCDAVLFPDPPAQTASA